jgi:hypothetical protein
VYAWRLFCLWRAGSVAPDKKFSALIHCPHPGVFLVRSGRRCSLTSLGCTQVDASMFGPGSRVSLIRVRFTFARRLVS